MSSGATSVAGMNREAGIPKNTSYIWVKRYREHREQSFVVDGHVYSDGFSGVYLAVGARVKN